MARGAGAHDCTPPQHPPQATHRQCARTFIRGAVHDLRQWRPAKTDSDVESAFLGGRFRALHFGAELLAVVGVLDVAAIEAPAGRAAVTKTMPPHNHRPLALRDGGRW